MMELKIKSLVHSNGRVVCLAENIFKVRLKLMNKQSNDKIINND